MGIAISSGEAAFFLCKLSSECLEKCVRREAISSICCPSRDEHIIFCASRNRTRSDVDFRDSCRARLYSLEDENNDAAAKATSFTATYGTPERRALIRTYPPQREVPFARGIRNQGTASSRAGKSRSLIPALAAETQAKPLRLKPDSPFELGSARLKACPDTTRVGRLTTPTASSKI